MRIYFSFHYILLYIVKFPITFGTICETIYMLYTSQQAKIIRIFFGKFYISDKICGILTKMRKIIMHGK